MGNEKKNVVRKWSRKELATVLSTRRAALSETKKSWDVKLKNHLVESDKEVMRFKVSMTGVVKEANRKRVEAITKASKKLDAQIDGIRVERATMIATAEKVSADALVAINEEWQELKHGEEEKFRKVSNATDQDYRDGLVDLKKTLNTDHEAIRQNKDQAVDNLVKEIAGLEEEFERRRELGESKNHTQKETASA